MSILINMEMPKHCGDCRFSVDGWCYVIPETHRQPKLDYIARPDWCPIVEIPPHGRLIDADALCKYCDNQIDHSVTLNDIMRMPTVIPADKDGEA